MIWFRPLGWVEITVTVAFVGLYCLYLYRVIAISRSLNTPFTSVFAKLFLRAVFFAEQ